MTLATLVLLRDLINKLQLQVASPDFAQVAQGLITAIGELDAAIESARAGAPEPE